MFVYLFIWLAYVYQENPDSVQDKDQLEANIAAIWGRVCYICKDFTRLLIYNQYFLTHLQNAKKPNREMKEVLFEEFANKHPKFEVEPNVPQPIQTFDQVQALILPCALADYLFAGQGSVFESYAIL